MGLFSRNECLAQSTTWTGSDPATVASANTGSDENTVFLYNVKTGKFLNCGGYWGVAAVLSDVGVEFTVSGNASDGYVFNTKMMAQKSGEQYTYESTSTCLAYASNQKQYVLDRATTESQSQFSLKFTVTKTSDNKGYTLVANSRYMAAGKSSDASGVVDEANAITGFTNAPTDDSGTWLLVTMKERKQAFMKTSNNEKTNVPGTFLVKDNDFSRRNTYLSSWFGGDNALSYDTNTANEGAVTPSNQTLTYYVGNGATDTESNSPKWTGNVKGATGDLHQTVSPFRHGWYEIRCRAFSTTTSGTPVLYAKVGEATSKTSAKSEYAEAAITKLATAPSSYIAANDEVNKTTTANSATYYPYEVVVRVYVPETTSTNGTQTTADETTSTDGVVNYETCSDLTFGVKTSNGESTDWLCVDNFELEYLGEGNNNVVLDETQESVDYMNAQSKGVNSTIYINRSLTANKWNSILLPFDMTQNDIISIFGSGTIVSKYVGAKENDNTTIHFEKTTTIEKGKLYIIKPTVGEPTSQPAVASSTMKTNNASEAVLSFNANSAYYTIPNIVYGTSSTDEADKFTAQVTGDTKEVVSGGEQYTFAGTYVKKTQVIPLYSYRLNALGETDHTGSTGNWVVNTAHTAHSLGFRGWLQKADTNTTDGAAKLSFVIDGIEDETTAIDGITFDGAAATTATAKGIYTISGQRVNASAESLPRGLYIVNGKKVVVK